MELSTVHTAPRLKQIIGGGLGTVSVAGSCPGSNCNQGDQCLYFMISGSLAPIHGILGGGATSISACLVADDSTFQGDGTGGGCDSASGNGQLTGKSGTGVDMVLAGNICNSFPLQNDDMLLLGHSTYKITGGSGKMSTATGVGSIELALDLTTANVTLSLSGSFTRH